MTIVLPSTSQKNSPNNNVFNKCYQPKLIMSSITYKKPQILGSSLIESNQLQFTPGWERIIICRGQEHPRTTFTDIIKRSQSHLNMLIFQHSLSFITWQDSSSQNGQENCHLTSLNTYRSKTRKTNPFPQQSDSFVMRTKCKNP